MAFSEYFLAPKQEASPKQEKNQTLCRMTGQIFLSAKHNTTWIKLNLRNYKPPISSLYEMNLQIS